MRLICPQCGVQYEVDGSLIPANGRDVQCSNCSETWFVKPERTPVPDMRRPSMPRPEPAPETASPVGTAEESAAAPQAGPAEPRAPEPAPEPEPAVEADAGARSPAPEPDEDAARDRHEAPPEIRDPHLEDAYEASAVIGREAPEHPEHDPADAPVPPAPSARKVARDPHSIGAMPGLHDAARIEVPEAEEPEDTEEPLSAGDVEDDGFEPDEGDVVAPPPRRHDDAVLDILREEAARETEARRRETAAGPIETQPDLGLEPAPRRALGMEARVERLRGLAERPDDGPEAGSVAATASEEDESADEDRHAHPRRELLPDIEEINSTLRPAASHAREEPALAAHFREMEHRRGFRIGFGAMVAVAVLLVASYVYAPWIARTFPGLEPTVIAWVETSNAARDGIDGALTRSVRGIERLIGSGS